jgi:Tfp pilus assembly protein PilE
MRAALGLVGLLIVVLIAYLIYSSQQQQIAGDKPLMQQTNAAAVRTDLLSLAQTERLYYATNGRYAALDELRRANVMNSVPGTGRAGYQYEAELEGDAHFQITAIPKDSSKADLPTLSIDETLQISTTEQRARP